MKLEELFEAEKEVIKYKDNKDGVIEAIKSYYKASKIKKMDFSQMKFGKDPHFAGWWKVTDPARKEIMVVKLSGYPDQFRNILKKVDIEEFELVNNK
jgi:hypothetical protein